MTPLLLAVLIGLALYGLYIAARVARLGGAAGDFIDGGRSLPGWAAMFLLPGLAVAGLGVTRHLHFVSTYGLQASHVAVGLVLVAMAALFVWNRMWLVTRIAGMATPGQALGRYYDSVALRVLVLGLTALYAIPFAADLLSLTALMLEAATSGLIPRTAGIWLFAFALAAPAIVGGWRATVLSLAMQAVLLVVLLAGTTLLAEVVATSPGFPGVPVAVADGIFWDRIPGVLQNVAGIGKSVPAGGIFTTVAIVSSAVALIGIVVSPAALFLGQTVRSGGTLAVSAVWLTAGLAGGILILGTPALAVRVAPGLPELAEALHATVPLAGVGLWVLQMLGGLMLVAFFVCGGAMIFTREMILTYLLPHLGALAGRLTARITMGFAFFLMAMAAAFAPVASAIAASVTLPLSVQLLPALLGLGYLRWISPGAVLSGIAIGSLIVVSTEPLGLILFEALFVELPWGRWPLTIHSAVWGLAFNLAFTLLVSSVTLRSPDRFERARLHNAISAAAPTSGAGGRSLLWSLFLLWGFFAYGPGAILGNTFFLRPIFSDVEAALGIPSLWVWQILFWLLGVVLVWWLAYRVGLGRLRDDGIRPISFGPEDARRAPDWLAAGLARVAQRPSRGRTRRGTSDPAAAPIRRMPGD